MQSGRNLVTREVAAEEAIRQRKWERERRLKKQKAMIMMERRVRLMNEGVRRKYLFQLGDRNFWGWLGKKFWRARLRGSAPTDEATHHR